jgi:hypothetical protein
MAVTRSENRRGCDFEGMKPKADPSLRTMNDLSFTGPKAAPLRMTV